MSFDTSNENKTRQDLTQFDQIWLFAYGSLLYKVDFDYIEKRPAYITGWARKFWQGSHDHRGTHQAPGRVVTLVPQPNTQCHGIAYKVTPQVFEHLDIREKNGYLRHQTTLHLNQGDTKQGIIYIADKHNAAYLGPAPVDEMAKQIHRCHGPSGANRDYLLALNQSLNILGIQDPNIQQLAAAVLGLNDKQLSDE